MIGIHNKQTGQNTCLKFTLRTQTEKNRVRIADHAHRLPNA